ncbi:DUF488 domain-containing protein [Nonomuraea sp. LPB2021202275-12-8]|uniref:DUF488 domain-containing protein n=1 Tax=Nonomuraea sp. LPB2021202275-12-8 TaxID=3120159 RepID=UPI003FA58C4D
MRVVGDGGTDQHPARLRPRDVAPSTELREWFGHRPERFAEFAERYKAELAGHREAVEPLLEAAAKGAVTLLYSARDTERNQAVVLRDFLQEQASAR